MTVEQLFKCKHCGEEKPYDEMRKDARMKNGIILECKACRNDREAENGTYIKNQLRQYVIRKGEGDVNLTQTEIEALMNEKHCSYCNVEMTRGNHITPSSATIDHIYPLESDYGGVNLGINCVAACRGCNSTKHKFHVYDFYQRSEKFTPELWTAFVAEFGRRLMRRELTDIEVEQLKRNLADEADDLRRNVESKAVATG